MRDALDADTSPESPPHPIVMAEAIERRVYIIASDTLEMLYMTLAAASTAYAVYLSK